MHADLDAFQISSKPYLLIMYARASGETEKPNLIVLKHDLWINSIIHGSIYICHI